jgi:putative membrane protein insertion efficiency factor
VKFLRRLYVAPLHFYRKFISPLKPPMCRFHPTCSQYGIDAVLQHGILKGTRLALWRLLRCQPFAAGGHDPVPPRRSP